MRHVKIVRSNRPVTQRFQLRPLFFRGSWSITTFIGSIAAMTTLAGILLHGCGHVAYTSYLDTWGVQADLFPQSADWKVIRGYYALVFQGARIIKSVPWSALAISVLLLTIPIWLYRLPARPKSRPYKPFIEKRPWLRELLSSTAISVAVVYLILTAYFVVLLIAIIPGLIGERAGVEQATKEELRLLGPISRIETELWRGGERRIRGHIIASNSELIAIYDVDLHQVRTMSRGDFEIRRVAQ
ncbi:hypothetical protein [Pseudoxanthomonas winnipegensis]|jgi:hypothetical protein|nr:hypothetical protein [Pseudoxanthomonas winnipegensis]